MSFEPQCTSSETEDPVHLILLATYDLVFGSRGFFDQVDDETSVQTALNDALMSSARSNRCPVQCRSRCPLTQRGSSNFDVCGIWLGGVQSNVELEATRFSAVGHCKDIFWGRVRVQQEVPNFVESGLVPARFTLRDFFSLA